MKVRIKLTKRSILYIIIYDMSTKKRKKNKSDIVTHSLLRHGVMKTAAFVNMGISRAYLSKMKKQGLITQYNRGYYTLQHYNVSEHHSFVEASVAIPGGIICLLSALQFHGLTTQNPFKVWIAISSGRRTPAFKGVPTTIVHYSKTTLSEGVELHKIEGVQVKIFNVAKTIADCFKFRNKIGVDVAIEALKDGLKNGRCEVDDIWRYAKICRVAKTMRPYMEALT